MVDDLDRAVEAGNTLLCMLAERPCVWRARTAHRYAVRMRTSSSCLPAELHYHTFKAAQPLSCMCAGSECYDLVDLIEDEMTSSLYSDGPPLTSPSSSSHCDLLSDVALARYQYTYLLFQLSTLLVQETPLIPPFPLASSLPLHPFSHRWLVSAMSNVAHVITTPSLLSITPPPSSTVPSSPSYGTAATSTLPPINVISADASSFSASDAAPLPLSSSFTSTSSPSNLISTAISSAHSGASRPTIRYLTEIQTLPTVPTPTAISPSFTKAKSRRGPTKSQSRSRPAVAASSSSSSSSSHQQRSRTPPLPRLSVTANPFAALSNNPVVKPLTPRARRHSLPPSSSSPLSSQPTLPPTSTTPSSCPLSPSSVPTALPSPGPLTGASQSLTTASDTWQCYPSSLVPLPISVESTDDTPLTPIDGTCHDLLIIAPPSPVTPFPPPFLGRTTSIPHTRSFHPHSQLPMPLPPHHLAYHLSFRLPSHSPHLDRQQTCFCPLPQHWIPGNLTPYLSCLFRSLWK